MNSTIERYVIKHISGSKANQVEEFDFSKSELTIGRTAASDIQFDPEQDVVVSREHGKITRLTNEPLIFEVVDNNSRNGIFVNKQRVKGSQRINVGDEVQLGNNGPVFSFDIYPRPQDMMQATRVVEIPASIKPTSISEVIPAPQMVPAETVKTGLGKQTVERMLVAERKKSGSKLAVILGSLVIILGIAGFAFRDKLFPKPTTIIQEGDVVVLGDTAKSKIMTPDVIARENDDKVVAIEFAWQLKEAQTNDELWHKYDIMTIQGRQMMGFLYIRNSQGQIEPYLDTKKEVQNGVPVAVVGASGTGFVVSADGFILTNRHVGAGWLTRYNFMQGAFPGGLVIGHDKRGNPIVDTNTYVMPQDVMGWVPSNASMVGGRQVNPGDVVGENTYLKVIFSGTSMRRNVTSVDPSEDHDVAILKVNIAESLSAVKLKDNYDEVKPGQSVTVMGYPGVAPVQFVARKSQDPFNPQTQYVTVPTPTVTPGNIGRIIPGTSEKDLSYSTFGDSYQLTINATGGGNSGGPMFDNEGNVIGIYYAGANLNGTQISFAIPIKYGLELMGRTKVGGHK
ncbi:MAG: trypsin-like peptidase domain-containing protein [Flavisolibacter sp.]